MLHVTQISQVSDLFKPLLPKSLAIPIVSEFTHHSLRVLGTYTEPICAPTTPDTDKVNNEGELKPNQANKKRREI